MLTGVLLVGENGEVLLQKEFLHSQKKWKPDTFGSLLKKNGMKLPTCIPSDGNYYFHLQRDKLYLVAVTENQEASPIIIYEYLENLSDILKDYIGSLFADTILSNIGLAYEIVSESTNAGFPKLLDIAKLKPLLCNAVSQSNNKSNNILELLPDNLFGAVEKKRKETSGVASRKPIYTSQSGPEKKNELYIDLIETLSVIVDSNGAIVLCNITGTLDVKSYLLGNAEVSITFSELKNELSNAIVNPAISTNDLPRMIKATVSPGNTKVMSYHVRRLGEERNLPFTMYTNIQPNINDKLVTLNLKVYCGLPISHHAANLLGKIPLPEATTTITGASSLANVTFHHDRAANEYHFNTPWFPGASQHTVSIKILLSSWSPAILFELSRVVLQFEVPMLCHSNMKISGLKVNKTHSSVSNDHVNKWVRCLTHANSYEFYLNDDWYPT